MPSLRHQPDPLEGSARAKVAEVMFRFAPARFPVFRVVEGRRWLIVTTVTGDGKLRCT